MPATDDFLLWHEEMSGLLSEAMTIWDAAEKLLTTVILSERQDDEPTVSDEPAGVRERVLENLRARLQPLFDAQHTQLYWNFWIRQQRSKLTTRLMPSSGIFLCFWQQFQDEGIIDLEQ